MNPSKNLFALVVALPLPFCLALPLCAQTPDPDFYQKSVFGNLAWQELGPTSFSGRIVDIAVHPTNSSIWWVASASGGIWYTENRGISFTPQFQNEYTTSIGDIAVAPSAPETLYVGTGEANNQRSSYWGNGVWKSTDGGKNWFHVGLDGTDHIGRIVVHPQNPDIVYVAALGSLYRANEHRGLYRTADGGRTWERVHFVSNQVGAVDVALDPGQPDTIYLCTYERLRRAWHFSEGGAGSRVHKSTDGGKTWQTLAGGLPEGTLGRIGIDICQSKPNTVYLTIENLNPAPPARETPAEASRDGERGRDGDGEGGGDGETTPDAETLADPVAMLRRQVQAAEAQDPERQDPQPARRRSVGGEVYRSDDAGATWRKVNGSRAIGGEPGYYYGQIRVAPSDPDQVYVLSVAAYSSTDGGKTWHPAPRARGGRGGRGAGGEQPVNFGNSLHSDHHALWIDPQHAQRCVLGNDGGLAVTFDGGRTWDHNNRLPLAQYYAVGVDNRVPYRIYGGTQDNGSWGFPVQAANSGGIQIEDSFRINGGDGFYVCVDPDNPDIVYSESQFGAVSRQNLRTGESKSIKPRAEAGMARLRSNWNSPILISPHNSATVYFGTQHLHRSRDRGDRWQTISDDLTTNDADKLKGNVPHCTITTISESPRKEGWLWVGTDDGRVWTTRDGGVRWTELTDRFPAETKGLWVSRVEASPHGDGTCLVAFTGYREDIRTPLVYRTDDGGETFRTITTGLPQEPVNVVRSHPTNSNVLFCGTEMGAYVSVDGGAGWFALGKGLPRVAVHDLAFQARERHLIAGTHGRGIFVLDARAFDQLDLAALENEFVVLPPSDGVILGRSWSAGNEGARTWSAPNPFTAPTFRFYLREDQDQKVKVEVIDAKGAVQWTQEVSEKAGLHEVSWSPARGGGRGPAGQGQERQGQGPGQQGQGAPRGGQRSGGTGEAPANPPISPNNPSAPAAPPADPSAQGERPSAAPGQGQGQGPGLADAARNAMERFRQGGGRRGGPQGPRPGQFAVRVTLGERVVVLPFRIVDRRPSGHALGGVPAIGAERPVDEEELLGGEEEQEQPTGRETRRER